MARTQIEVDKDYLVRSITAVEEAGPCGGFSELFSKVAEKYNEKAAKAPGSLRAITPAIVGLRIKSWGLKTKTTKGKRGRAAGFGPVSAGKHVRVKRADKFAANPELREALVKLRENTPAKYHPLVDQVGRGSRVAADKLKCLDCSGWQPIEVKNCTIKRCSLFSFRPYQKVTIRASEADTEAAFLEDDKNTEQETEELVG